VPIKRKSQWIGIGDFKHIGLVAFSVIVKGGFPLLRGEWIIVVLLGLVRKFIVLIMMLGI